MNTLQKKCSSTQNCIRIGEHRNEWIDSAIEEFISWLTRITTEACTQKLTAVSSMADLSDSGDANFVWEDEKRCYWILWGTLRHKILGTGTSNNVFSVWRAVYPGCNKLFLCQEGKETMVFIEIGSANSLGSPFRVLLISSPWSQSAGYDRSISWQKYVTFNASLTTLWTNGSQVSLHNHRNPPAINHTIDVV